jgi:hypothetical protein
MVSVSITARWFTAFSQQGYNKYQACDQKDNAADQCERVMVYNAGCNKKAGAYDEKNPAP